MSKDSKRVETLERRVGELERVGSEKELLRKHMAEAKAYLDSLPRLDGIHHRWLTEHRPDPKPVSLDALRRCIELGEKVILKLTGNRAGILKSIGERGEICLEFMMAYSPLATGLGLQLSDILSAERVGMDAQQIKVGDTFRSALREVKSVHDFRSGDQVRTADIPWFRPGETDPHLVITAHTPAVKDEPVAWLCVKDDAAEERYKLFRRGEIAVIDHFGPEPGRVAIRRPSGALVTYCDDHPCFRRLYLRDMESVSVGGNYVLRRISSHCWTGPIANGEDADVLTMIRNGKAVPTFKRSVVDKILAEHPVEKRWYLRPDKSMPGVEAGAVGTHEDGSEYWWFGAAHYTSGQMVAHTDWFEYR